MTPFFILSDPVDRYKRHLGRRHSGSAFLIMQGEHFISSEQPTSARQDFSRN
jgi:hypothetical protein